MQALSRTLALILIAFFGAGANAFAGGSLPVIQDNSGSFAYQVPIAVPPGPGGSTPELALLYSSAGGNGNAGFGWTLPYSSIRLDLKWGVPHYWLPDDICDPDQFSGRLYLDGMETVPSTSDPLAPAGTCIFRTRPDTFALIVPIFDEVSCGGPAAQLDGGPTGFAVVRQDGTAWWYGDSDACSLDYRVLAASAEGRVATEWLLHHVEDRDGNVVTFHPDRNEDRFEPLQWADATPRAADDRGASDASLRAITWAEHQREAGGQAYFGDPQPVLSSGPGSVASGFEYADSYADHYRGLSGSFDQFLGNPGAFWPEPRAHYYVAMIDWEDRPDVRTSFLSGGAQVQDRRIRQVAIGANATAWRGPEGFVNFDLDQTEWVRSYRLDYDQGTTARSRLSRVWTFPGEYDPSAAYSHRGVPVDGSEVWVPEDHVDNPYLVNPWEFVYSDSSVADPDAWDDPWDPTVATLEDPVSMSLTGPSTKQTVPQPWMGSNWTEGGFPSISTMDWNGDGLVDLVQHAEELPIHPKWEDNLLTAFLPWNDMSPNPTVDYAADLDNGHPQFWVRFNQGDGFAEIEPVAFDPLALQPVGDFIPQMSVYPEQSQEGDLSAFAVDGVTSAALEAEDDHEAERLAEDVAWLVYPDEDPWSSDLREFVSAALMARRNTSASPEDRLLDLSDAIGDWDFDGDGDFETLAMLVSPTLDGPTPEEADAWTVFAGDNFPAGEAGGLCSFWWSGIPNLMVHLGLPTPIDPRYGSWCEHRSCSPFCETGTTVTAGLGRHIGPGLDPLVQRPDGYMGLEITKPGAGDDPELTLWRRYAGTRSASGHWLSTLAEPHGMDPILLGLEARSKNRWVDGYAHASFQTRIRSSHLERLRNADLPLDSPTLVGAFAASKTGSAPSVQDGLIHDTIDMNGDGYGDRVVAGAAVLQSHVSPDEAVWNKRMDGDKELVVSTAHMPWFVSLWDAEAGEFGPLEPWRMPLSDPLLMGGPDVFPDPALASAGANDPRLFGDDTGFSFLGVWEGTTDAAPAAVQARASATVGALGPAAGAAMSVGPISFSYSLTADGASWGLGVGPASFGATGMSVGPVTFEYGGGVSASAASVIAYVIIKVLETFEIPWQGGVGVSSTGLTLNVPGLGGDATNVPRSVRWQRQGLHDLNGDGRPDYVIAHVPRWENDAATADLHWLVLFNEGDGWSEPTEFAGVDTTYLEATLNDAYRHDGADATGPGVNSDLGYRRGHQIAGLRDLNADGLPDFAYTGRLLDGACPVPTRTLYEPDSGVTALRWARKKSSMDAAEEVSLCVQLNNGSGFEPPVDWFPQGAPNGGVHVGHAQHFAALSSNRVRIQQSVTYDDMWGRGVTGLQDFNGDGLPDYWVLGAYNAPADVGQPAPEDGVVHVYPNTGRGFQTAEVLTSAERYGTWRLKSFPLAQVQRQPSASPDFSGDYAQPVLDRSRTYERPGGSYVQSAFLDLDGNGTLDWAQSWLGGDAGGWSAEILAFPLQDAVPDLLTGIWEPGGARKAQAFGPARDWMDLPDKPSAVTMANGVLLSDGLEDSYPASAQVLEAQTTWHGLGEDLGPASTVEYKYGDPDQIRGHLSFQPGFWRRPLGFEEVVASDAEAEVRSWYRNTLIGGGQPGELVVRSSAGELLSRTITDYSLVPFSSNYPGPASAGWNFFAPPVKSTTSVHEPSGALSSTVWTDYNPLNGLPSCTRSDPDGDNDVDLMQATLYDVGLIADGRMDAVATQTVVLPPDGALMGTDEDACGDRSEWLDNNHALRRTTYGHHPSGRVAVSIVEDLATGVSVGAAFDYSLAGQPTMVEDGSGGAAHGAVAHSVDPSGNEAFALFDSLGRPFATADTIDVASGQGSTLLGWQRSVRRVPVDETPAVLAGWPAVQSMAVPFEDPAGGGAKIHAYSFVDGLGRSVLQTEDWIDEDGTPGQRVSGFAARDERGRPFLSVWPCFSSTIRSSQEDFSPSASLPAAGLCDDSVPTEQFVYDVLDRVTEHHRPDGATITREFSIDPAARASVTLTELHDAGGGSLQRTREAVALRLKETTRYDAITSLQSSTSSPLPTAVGNGPSEVVTLERFDALGRRTSVERTPLPGPATLFEWDGLDRLVSYSDPDQGDWSFGYDSAGRLQWRGRAGAAFLLADATEWTYDAQGRVVEEAYFEDLAAVVTGAPNHWWEWQYDSGDLLVQPSPTAELLPLGPVGQPALAMHWQADACDTALAQPDVTLEWRHDARGRVVEESQTVSSCEWPEPEVPEAWVAHYGYANNGQRTWTEVPMSGEHVRTLLDGIGRPAAMFEAAPNGPWDFTQTGTTYVESANWEIKGRPTELVLGNGVAQSYEYETGSTSTGALVHAQVAGAQGKLLDRAFAWDAAGNLKHWEDLQTGQPLDSWYSEGEEFDCWYDGLGSLLGCAERDPPDPTIFHYEYDPAGNLVHEYASTRQGVRTASQFVRNGASLASAFPYSAPLNAPVARVESAIGFGGDRAQSFEYDTRGHVIRQRYHDPALTSAPGGAEVAQRGLTEPGNPAAVLPSLAEREFDWDASGRLRGVAVSVGGGPPESVSWYRYDAGGNRVESIFIPASGSSTSDPVRTRRFGGLLETTERVDDLTDGTVSYSFAGMRVAQRDGAPPESSPFPWMQLRWVAGDHLGSASIVTDVDGNLVRGVRYEPYGRIRQEWGGDARPEDFEPGAVEELFNGKPRSRKAFGLDGAGFELEGYDYGARVYLPELSRWASADSITPDVVWEANPFAYVANNPLKYVDPTGHALCFKQGEVVGGASCGEKAQISQDAAVKFAAGVGIVFVAVSGEIAIELLPVGRARTAAEAIDAGVDGKRLLRADPHMRRYMSAAKRPGLFKRLFQRIRGSDGPGKWEWNDLGERGLDFQVSNAGTVIRQREDGKLQVLEYLVSGRHFDDFDDAARLIDYKDDMGGLIAKSGEFEDWVLGIPGWVAEARGQLRVAGDTPVVWRVADERNAAAWRKLFLDNDLPIAIEVVTP